MVAVRFVDQGGEEKEEPADEEVAGEHDQERNEDHLDVHKNIGKLMSIKLKYGINIRKVAAYFFDLNGKIPNN